MTNAIRSAVEELVSEKGRDKVSIPMVADRAGVNATTIYRRWPDAATMINDIATYQLDPDRPLPDTGDLRSDVAAWATEVLTHYRQPVNAALCRRNCHRRPTAGRLGLNDLGWRHANAAHALRPPFGRFPRHY